MKGSASDSPQAPVAMATTTEVQVAPTGLLQLDREQASGFGEQRFGSRVVRSSVKRRVWGERPGNQVGPRLAAENAPQRARFSHAYLWPVGLLLKVGFSAPFCSITGHVHA